MNFSIILVNSKNPATILSRPKEWLLEHLLATFPVAEVQYANFKANTEYTDIPLYIMSRKNEERTIQLKTLDAVRGSYLPHQFVTKYSSPMTHSKNPRYMSADLHIITDIPEIICILKISISSRVPVSQCLIHTQLAKHISMSGTEYCTVLSQCQEYDTEIEHVSKWGAGTCSMLQEDTIDSGIIGKISSEMHISPNKIMAQMDNNIEILLAPLDLTEAEELLSAYKYSKKFIEEEGWDKDPRLNKEYMQSIADITIIERDCAKYRELIKKEPKVYSTYLRLYDTNAMEKYHIRKTGIKKNTEAEVWA